MASSTSTFTKQSRKGEAHLVRQIALFAIGFFVCMSEPGFGDALSDRMAFWDTNAFTCKESGLSFPSKERNPTPQDPTKCNDGDMTLFNGLLCWAGDTRGCDGVRDAQDKKTGRWWRSPRRIGIEHSSSNGEDVSFSPDMALGVYLYVLTKNDRAAFDRWVDWIWEFRPCLVPGFNDKCALQGWPRFCTDDEEDKRCTFRPGNCAVLEMVGNFLGSNRADLCRKVLRSFKIKDDYIIPEGELAAGGALLNDPGFPSHLAAVDILTLELTGNKSKYTLFGAALLALRESKNPFFLYLAEGKSQRVRELVLDLCPSPDHPSLAKTEWSWERTDGDKAWLKSMYWDCTFMGRLLTN